MLTVSRKFREIRMKFHRNSTNPHPPTGSLVPLNQRRKNALPPQKKTLCQWSANAPMLALTLVINGSSKLTSSKVRLPGARSRPYHDECSQENTLDSTISGATQSFYCNFQNSALHCFWFFFIFFLPRYPQLLSNTKIEINNLL